MIKHLLLSVFAAASLPSLSVAQAPATPPAAAPAEKPTHRVILKEVGPDKVLTAMIVREWNRTMPLEEASKLVETLPATVKETDRSEAEKVALGLSLRGSKVDVQEIATGKIVGIAPAPKSTHRVVLEDFGPSKIQAIRVVREWVPGMGLAAAKTLVESAPTATVKECDLAEAERTVKALAEVGAKAEVEPLK